MTCQVLFSVKSHKKYIYLKVSSAAIVIGALRVNVMWRGVECNAVRIPLHASKDGPDQPAYKSILTHWDT